MPLRHCDGAFIGIDRVENRRGIHSSQEPRRRNAYRGLVEGRQAAQRFRIETEIDEGRQTGTRQAMVNAALLALATAAQLLARNGDEELAARYIARAQMLMGRSST